MEHYFSEKPESEYREKEIIINIKGTDFKFVTASGVFSYGKLDRGTQVLAEGIDFDKAKSFLDLGCGWGFLGIYARILVPSVVMVDINERALKLARRNCKLNKMKCEVLKSDGFSSLKGRKFDIIATNPPNHAGKKLIMTWIEEAKNYLVAGGKFYIVCKTRLGAKAYQEFMEEIFGNAKIVNRGSGYKVILSKNL